MLVIGALITIASAIAFLALGALALFGGADATRGQVLPGFLPDNPGVLERMLTFAGVWVPVILIATLCMFAGIRLFQVAIMALTGTTGW